MCVTVIASDFFLVCYVLFFFVSGCMFCLVRYLFVIRNSTIDRLRRFDSELTYYPYM